MRKLICRIFGHRWWFDFAKPAPKEGWWFEWHECSRCGARTRQMVASERG